MRTITATDASRGFSELLDAVENGETILVTRGNRTIAQITPAPAATGRALRAALAALPPLDHDLEADIAAATSLLTDDGAAWPEA